MQQKPIAACLLALMVLIIVIVVAFACRSDGRNASVSPPEFLSTTSFSDKNPRVMEVEIATAPS